MKGFAIQLNDNSSNDAIFDLKKNIVRDLETSKIITGFSFGDVLQQNTALILIATPGELEHAPTLGVGINDILLDDNLLSLRHLARRSFKMDGMKIEKLEMYNIEKLEIKTTY